MLKRSTKKLSFKSSGPSNQTQLTTCGALGLTGEAVFTNNGLSG
jgi:hypothetical protein